MKTLILFIGSVLLTSSIANAQAFTWEQNVPPVLNDSRLPSYLENVYRGYSQSEQRGMWPSRFRLRSPAVAGAFSTDIMHRAPGPNIPQEYLEIRLLLKHLPSGEMMVDQNMLTVMLGQEYDLVNIELYNVPRPLAENFELRRAAGSESRELTYREGVFHYTTNTDYGSFVDTYEVSLWTNPELTQFTKLVIDSYRKRGSSARVHTGHGESAQAFLPYPLENPLRNVSAGAREGEVRLPYFTLRAFWPCQLAAFAQNNICR